MRRLAVVAQAMLAAAACSTHMGRVNRAIKEYDTCLVLVATVQGQDLRIGQDAELQLVLRNRRTVGSIDACIGVTRRYRLSAVPYELRESRPPVAESGGLIDHPYCERRFALGPGEQLSWSEKWRVSDIGAGGAALRAAIQVVHPRDCEHLYGCYDTMIEAEPVAVTLWR
jgi:hypothetical protein